MNQFRNGNGASFECDQSYESTDISRDERGILLPARHVNAPSSIICYRSPRMGGGCDTAAHPCTMTLGGEVEQGRVNVAAGVG